MSDRGRNRQKWEQQKQLVLERYSPEPSRDVADVLRQHGYERITRVPSQGDVLSGLPRELFLVLNSLWGFKYRLFSMSGFPPVHRIILKSQNANLHYFFRVMFLNELATRSELQRHFSDPLIDRLLETRALGREDQQYRFTLSFVPYESLILARDAFPLYLKKKTMRCKDRVWLGADSIALAQFLNDFLSGRQIKNALEIGAGTGIIERARLQEYKQRGISHCLDYTVILRKGGEGTFRRQEANYLRKFRNLSYVRMVKLFSAVKSM